jgi:hypothetical protein
VNQQRVKGGEVAKLRFHDGGVHFLVLVLSLVTDGSGKRVFNVCDGVRRFFRLFRLFMLFRVVGEGWLAKEQQGNRHWQDADEFFHFSKIYW